MKNVHVFHGADNKTGTTMITQSVAEYIASKKRDIKVMIISLHGRPGTEYVDRVGESVEGIRLHLDSRVLNTEKLIEECRIRDNLYILGGVKSIEQVRDYHPDMAVYLLESLEESFDLIFVDAGNDIDNALAVGALERAENRYCVITQQESILMRYESIKPFYDRLGITFSSFIVNRHTDNDVYDLRYIEKRLSLQPERLVKVGVSGYERRAESERRTLLWYKNEEFCKDIHGIANRVLYKAHMEPISDERKRKWLASI
ncbi:hypothetical protein MASR2M70_05280 [Bacillota bacterium]